MTVQRTGALSGDADKWKAIDWQKAQRFVRRLQMRIAKAVKEKRQGKVKTLQWLLTHSRHAKLLAVKRVTSNKGKKTPGIDCTLWKGPKAKRVFLHLLYSFHGTPTPIMRVRNGRFAEIIGP